jgi:hypothetical protein
MASSYKPSSGATTTYPQGLRGTPYVIKVDIDYPEKNWEFEVTFVHQIIHAGGPVKAFQFKNKSGLQKSAIGRL